MRMEFCVLILFLLTNSSVALLNKCCRDNEVVQVEYFEDNMLAPRKHFSCVQKSQTRVKVKKKRQSDKYVNANSTYVSQMIAYNLVIDKNSHWPDCGDKELFVIRLADTSKVSKSGSCVDVMEGSYHIFSCDDTPEDYLNVLKLRKCCAKNFSYDIFARRCVVNNDTKDVSEEYHQFMQDKVVAFESGIPECKAEEVLVEYHSNVHKLKIYESSLVITTPDSFGPDVLSQSSYCIESTLNFDVDHSKADNIEQFQLKHSSKWIAKVCQNKAICKQMPCVRKCCVEGFRMVYENETYCERHHSHLDVRFHNFDIKSSDAEPNVMEPSEYGIMMPKHCEKFHLDQADDIHFYSGIDGSLFLPDAQKFYASEEYCVDYFYYKDEKDFDPNADEVKVQTFVCFNDDEVELVKLRFRIYATLMAISAAFFGITFVVYISLPKLLNLHGKTLVCHVLSLFVAFSSLSAVQFTTDAKMTYCRCVAYIVYFSFLSAFSWLNVMCLDIYWAFGSMRMAAHGMRRTKEVKRFLCYSLYAWGLPCLLTVFTYMIDTYDTFFPNNFKPNIAQESCWFVNASWGHVIFFLAPVGIQTSVNVVLFIITAIHCNRVKSEIHRMQMNDNCEQKRRRYIADKAIFLMNLKLFIVMGISWLLEIFATIFNEGSWWLISDGFNLLQGVLVFLIFVFKRKVLVAFQKKLGIRVMGLRPKGVPGSTSTNMSTIDLHSASVSRHNGRIMKSNSSSTLTNTNLNIMKN